MGVFDNIWTKSSSQEPTQPASGPEVVENLENKPSIEAMETQDQQIDKTEEVDPRPVDSVSPESTPDTTETESAPDEPQPDYTEQLDSLQESLAEVKDVVENLQYNVSILVQNQASAADMAVMQRENEAFRSDSNMKLMRRYGIDAMIKTYQAICDKLFRINHPQPDTQSAGGEKAAFEWVLKRMERQFKQLGIRLQRSGPGSEFDGATMTVYGSEGEDVEEEETIFETNEESLKDTVKESVCPAFVWTIPSLIGDAKEWCMESEKVCIYK